jgi:hypothetical protein
VPILITYFIGSDYGKGKRSRLIVVTVFNLWSCGCDSMERPVDRSIYENCDLTDEEILERETKLSAQKPDDAEKERARIRRAENFRFKGGML